MSTSSSTSKKFPCSLCQFSNNINTLYTKNKLSSHQRKFHPNNCIIPHIKQSSLNNIPEIQVKNFWNSLLLRIEKKLSYHRSGSGSRKIIFEPFSEELFVKIFSQEENFTFISYLNKYKCVFTGELGYKRLGFLFDCEDWGEKKHVSGTKAYVFMEDEEKQKEVSFVWSDTIVTRNRDGKEPLTLNSPKLAVSFNILTGYFQDNNIDENCMSEGNSSLEIFV
ncbi:unnamed protein product [Rhizophagus irregularis]|uniref:Uncharacterized protein n=1 Tax=Rhizophagus irregularis TaxID=588596 RepID=A0A2N1MEB3_9GLOM|nr:hypothetical protein RhiirC2_871120 [Rhizophagus irregularis]PKK72266.1 hypothetical protein RhiirC2_848552 [Rhizophagus irregularis]CAB5366867.1 unnamed protein product [Rhizophagus irregularis]